MAALDECLHLRDTTIDPHGYSTTASMSIPHELRSSRGSYKSRGVCPGDGPTAGGHIVQFSMSLLVKIKQLKRRPMRPRSSPRPNRLLLQEDIPKTSTKSRLSLKSLPETTNTNVNPSEVCDQIIEALSTTITSNRANVTLDTPKGAPSNSEYSHFIYSDLHKGQLDKFVECLDRSEIEKELSGLETYGEFRKAVEHLGHLSHFENWRNNERPESCDFDVVQLKARLHDLEQARRSRDPDKMLQLIRTQLSRFNSDVDQETLFHPFLHGTKKIIEEYTDSVCRLFEDFTRLHARYGKESDRLRLAIRLEEVRLSFGETALLCSGE